MTVRRGHDAANAWLALSGIALGLATLYALAVVTFRLPVFSGDNRLLFRTALVLHVELAVFVWLMTTMAARWSALPAHRTGWLPPGIAAAGTFLLAMSPLAGGTPVMLDYFPILADNRLFILGFGLICAGILLAALAALWSSASDDTSRAAAWATLMAVLAALTTCLHPAAGIADIAWAAGHTLLFAHVIMLIGEWPRHAGVPLPAKGTRWLVVSATLLPWIPLAAPPGSPLFLSLYSQSMILLLWPPALWVIVRLAVSSNVAAPPFGRLTLTLSMSFFVVGCLLGSLIDAPTTLVTAHYHATMGAVALSRMAMTYEDQSGQRSLTGPNASRQLVTYAGGLALLTAGLALAALEGAPRKTPASELVSHGPLFVLGMSVSGIGGLLAMVGTGWWIHNRFIAPARRLSPQRTPLTVKNHES